MLCIKENELDTEGGRILIIKQGKVIDVTYPLQPHEVPADEVYYIRGDIKGN